MAEPRAFVSIIVPCRNERRHIAGLVESLVANDYPADRREMLIVDGMSDDGTREVLDQLAGRHEELRVVDNPDRTTPAALNRGIEAARGEIIVRADAHALYPPEYVRRLVEALEATGAGNVGGRKRFVPGGPGAVAAAIALALGHPFGSGGARYRQPTSAVIPVDTVPFGCFPRRVFDRVGLFDAELIRNQDDEFNARLLRAGEQVLLVPGVQVDFFARTSLRQLWRMHYQYGLFKPLVVRKLGGLPTLRQLGPAGFLLALLMAAVGAILTPAVGRPLLAVLAGAYLLASLLVAGSTAVRSGRASAWLMPLAFGAMHFGYACGYLAGLAPALLRPAGRRTRLRDMPLTR
jgi:glycosyltransferase involved in cell wall biosynthesis